MKSTGSSKVWTSDDFKSHGEVRGISLLLTILVQKAATANITPAKTAEEIALFAVHQRPRALVKALNDAQLLKDTYGQLCRR